MLPPPLLQMLTVIGPLSVRFSTTSKVIPVIERSFDMVVTRPGGFIWLKRKKGKGEDKKS